MPRVEIDKLGIEVPGLTAEQGRRLAEMVVDGLGGVQWPDKAPQKPENVSATVDAGAGKPGVEEMAAAIVREILRQIG